MTSKKTENRAFTLIELLVSVSIVSILVAILLPSLGEARRRAHRLVCENNLRSIWTGVLSYAYVYDERVPFAEDLNSVEPSADPFDSKYPTSIGYVLWTYVNDGSWRCPAAVAGWPADRRGGGWKVTYSFSTAGPLGDGVPYDSDPNAHSGGPLDPAISNYRHFDGRPLKLIDGRRYVQSGGLNQDRRGNWSVRFPIISDALAGKPSGGKPVYPHHGIVGGRMDLGGARRQFELNTNSPGRRPAYHELHADGEEATIFFTRLWMPHRPGY
jgi:prepilin-type N-terminal cleavage/methylation domain-containing protein